MDSTRGAGDRTWRHFQAGGMGFDRGRHVFRDRITHQEYGVTTQQRVVRLDGDNVNVYSPRLREFLPGELNDGESLGEYEDAEALGLDMFVQPGRWDGLRTLAWDTGRQAALFATGFAVTAGIAVLQEPVRQGVHAVANAVTHTTNHMTRTQVILLTGATAGIVGAAATTPVFPEAIRRLRPEPSGVVATVAASTLGGVAGVLLLGPVGGAMGAVVGGNALRAFNFRQQRRAVAA